MPTLGQRLREERLKRGLTIEQLAAQTRINAQYFAAIENDDVGALPGGFFYRSFLRQYTRLLELPESLIKNEIARSLDEEARTAATLPTALPDRNLNLPPLPTGRLDIAAELRRWLVRLAILVVAVGACSGIYTLYERWQARQDVSTTQSTPAPVSQPDSSQPKPAQPSPAPSATAIQQIPPPPQTLAEAPPPPPSAPASGAVRVIVRAHELTWVAVWQGEKLLFANTIHPQETRGFGAEDRLKVKFGNAGGVEVQWNGQDVPALGPRGQVRVVEFRPDGYTVASVVPPTEP